MIESAELTRALRLMAVTDDDVFEGRDPIAAIEAAVRGGATMVQLRFKRLTPRALAELARRVMAKIAVPVVINDRLDVALAVGAAGVHLGPDDVPPARARSLAPPGFIVGASVGSAAEVAAGASADYWGIGPWRATATKADAGAALGGRGFEAIVAVANGRPCVAIGAVRDDDVGEVLSRGGAGVAVVSGLFGASDVEVAARRYRAAFG